MPTYLGIDNKPYKGDQQQRLDGSYDPVIPDKPNGNYHWNGTAWTLFNAQKWTELGIEFRNPGKPLYASVFAKVMDAERNQTGNITSLLGLTTLSTIQKRTLAAATVRDHWNNFKILLMSSEIRDITSLINGIQHLKNLLNDAGFPLTATDISGWNALIDKYDFPNSCKL